MALSRTNVSSNVFDLGAATTATLSHNHPAGSDWIVVIVAVDSYDTISGVTYAGNAMTLNANYTSYYGGIWNVYEIDASATTGTNNVVVSGLTAYDKISVVAYSFSGSAGVGNTVRNNTPATSTDDKTESITISENAMIIACGWNGGGSFSDTKVEIPDGTAVTVNYTNAMYTCTWGGCSGSLSAGVVTCAVNQSVGYAAIILLIEVEEASVAPTRRRIIIV